MGKVAVLINLTAAERAELVGLALAERALNAEIDHHLEAVAAGGRANSRNGYARKSVLTETGKVALGVPRYRLSTFDPQLIGKYRRRFPGFDDHFDVITREIQGHLRELYGIDVSRPDQRCNRGCPGRGDGLLSWRSAALGDRTRSWRAD